MQYSGEDNCIYYMTNDEHGGTDFSQSVVKPEMAIDRFSWRGEGSLRAWMERIAVNVSLEALRQKRRLHYPTTVDRLPERYEEPTSDEMERLPYDDLKRLIAELPDGYRTVFNLYCIEELSHREIAERLGISEKTSSSQLFRAKALLARRIKEYVKDK